MTQQIARSEWRAAWRAARRWHRDPKHVAFPRAAPGPRHVERAYVCSIAVAQTLYRGCADLGIFDGVVQGLHRAMRAGRPTQPLAELRALVHVREKRVRDRHGQDRCGFAIKWGPLNPRCSAGGGR